MANSYKLSGQAVKKTAEAVRWVAAQERAKLDARRQPRPDNELFDAKIIAAATAINGAIRWKYTIELGHWDMNTSPTTGGTWVTDSTGTIYAFNSAEDMNTFTSGTGTIGTGNTGVAQSTGAVGSCTLKPLANGDYVQVKWRGYNDSGSQAYYTIINKSNSGQ